MPKARRPEKEKTISETYNNRRDKISNKEYQEYLKSDRWKRFKVKASKLKRFRRCMKKGCNIKEIELHHTTYRNLGTPKEFKDIIPLCRKHHQRVHDLSKETNQSVWRATRMVVYTKHEV